MSTDCSDCVVWDHKCTFLKVFIWYCCCWSGEPTLNIVILEKLSLEFLWMWIHLLLERKVITSWKAETALPIKVCLVKAMVFPVVMYECESWTVKKAEHRRIGAFELWCWRRLLRVPWTARRSNHSILKEISPGCSLEGMMLKLTLQYFGHLMRRVDSLEKTDAGRDWGQKEKGTTEDEMAGWHH